MSRRLVLVHHQGTLARRFDLGAIADGRSYVVGRSPECDFVLSDPRVSRRHLELRYFRGRLEARDLGSASGTLLDDRPLADWKPLADGAVLALSDHRLTLEWIPSDELGNERLCETVVPGSFLSRTLVEEPTFRVPADGSRAVSVPLEHARAVTLGRDPTATVMLSHPTISRFHTSVERIGDRCRVRDLDSTNGTFLNGARLETERLLQVGDRLRIGPYTLHFDGEFLLSKEAPRGTRIEVRGLATAVDDRTSGTPRWLLRDLDLVIEPREFVALLGSSGCGKSTFVDAINGRRPATIGRVLYDGTSLYDEFDALKRDIAYVPQDLIFHPHLPVERALYYASRLRLPDDTTAHEIEQNIDRVLETVGLEESKRTVIANLSGGQRKRVAIAMELLSKPSVLFLDEATSGLDAGTEARMMQLFRDLADSGVTTVCITHFVDSLELCDQVAYFVAGRLAYFGPPRGLRSAFSVEDVREVYVREKEREPAEWQERFRSSETHEQYVRERLEKSAPILPTSREPRTKEARATRRSRGRTQFAILTRRYVHVLSRDRRNVLLMLLLAPLIAGLVALALPGDPRETLLERTSRQGQLAFIMTLVMFFLGIFSSIREIVKELSIYRHERFVNLEILPYLASKVVPLAALGALQTAEFLTLLHLLTDVDGSPLLQFLFLFGTCATAMLLGLAISAAVNTADKAVLTMIVAIIPQLLFADAFIELRGAGEFVGRIAITSYWCHDGLENLLPLEQREARNPLDGTSVLRGQHPWHRDALHILAHATVFGLAALYFLRRKDHRSPRGTAKPAEGAGMASADAS